MKSTDHLWSPEIAHFCSIIFDFLWLSQIELWFDSIRMVGTWVNPPPLSWARLKTMGGFNLGISPDPLDSQPNTYRNGRPGLCEIKLWKTIVMIVRIRTSCSLSSKHFCRINAEKAQIHQNLRITKNIILQNILVWFRLQIRNL